MFKLIIKKVDRECVCEEGGRGKEDRVWGWCRVNDIGLWVVRLIVVVWWVGGVYGNIY